MTTGADLVLLAVDERRGTLAPTQPLRIALAAADLVDLARARRIEATPNAGVRVSEPLHTGDRLLDEMLDELSSVDSGRALPDILAARQAAAVERHMRALLNSGELSGREVTARLGGRPVYSGLWASDPARRADLVERLAGAMFWEPDSAFEPFGALAHLCGLSRAIPGWGSRHARRRLEILAERFGDTWRYLPGCRPELALGDVDLEPGQAHPGRERPWRLAERLAVQEARAGVIAYGAQGRRDWTSDYL